jgi:hypothetical protein
LHMHFAHTPGRRPSGAEGRTTRRYHHRRKWSTRGFGGADAAACAHDP